MEWSNEWHVKVVQNLYNLRYEEAAGALYQERGRCGLGRMYLH